MTKLKNYILNIYFFCKRVVYFIAHIHFVNGEILGITSEFAPENILVSGKWFGLLYFEKLEKRFYMFIKEE
jgi:hypothetical protein